MRLINKFEIYKNKRRNNNDNINIIENSIAMANARNE